MLGGQAIEALTGGTPIIHVLMGAMMIIPTGKGDKGKGAEKAKATAKALKKGSGKKKVAKRTKVRRQTTIMPLVFLSPTCGFTIDG